MKTPLQELIEWMDVRAITHESVRKKATELLEKEREVIENAWLNGVSAWDSEMEAEQYYNETFNQNK